MLKTTHFTKWQKISIINYMKKQWKIKVDDMLVIVYAWKWTYDLELFK